MTNPTSPASAPEQSSTSLIPPDTFRTLIALAIIALTIGGWIYVMMVPIDRFALSAQTRLWWLQQIVFVAVAIACIGIVLRKRSFLVPTFWLAFYALLFVLMRWLFQFRNGETIVPGFVILYALLLWRLQLARHPAPAEEGALTG